MLALRLALIMLLSRPGFPARPPQIRLAAPSAQFRIAGPSVDIRDFGATCDGVSNDANAVLAAIAAIPEGGGTVNISCLAGIGAPGITVSNRRQFTIRGVTPDAGFNALDADGRWTFEYPMILLLRDCTDCAVRDLRFEGNRIPVGLLRIERNEGTAVENNLLRNAGKTVTAALMGMGGRNNRYLWNTIDMTSRDIRGIWVGNPGSDIEYNPLIAFNSVRNAARFGDGIDGTGLTATISGGLVSYNFLENNYGSGIKVNPLPGDDQTVVIAGNRCINNGWSGITIGGDPDMLMRVSIRENYIEGTRLAGIGLDSRVTGDITGNTIRNNNRTMEQGWLGGIYIRQAANLVIESNRIEDSDSAGSLRQDHGIRLDPQIAGGIRNLHIRNNQIANNKLSGINIEVRVPGAFIDGVFIDGNTFRNNAVGLQIIEGAASTIRNLSLNSNNCFSANGASLTDNRGNRLAAPAQGNCSQQ